ncbi:DUF6415 family natural product biosynthesis protein [Streptomyces gilvus]|uniref:DUF6415 family natural product biosynthesis protein n=1 Tax=Streptomyces gilvus TaxID=2920937 RepID=UPI001F0F99D4|nr:DUF6415 family natural product biosynthesis protein [Streptomyces sp. CME 23]MCH5677950.1 DUF6415 family natural product biosynthesis protein [Streptomyces sp. CME 23]
MGHATAQPPATAGVDERPPDVATMRATARRLLGPDDGPDALPPAADIDTLTLALRGHLELILPDVEQAAGPDPATVKAYCALACVGEARRKLAITPNPELASRVAHARRLARVLLALCAHHDELGGHRP